MTQTVGIGAQEPVSGILPTGSPPDRAGRGSFGSTRRSAEVAPGADSAPRRRRRVRCLDGRPDYLSGLGFGKAPARANAAGRSEHFPTRFGRIRPNSFHRGRRRSDFGNFG